MHHWHSDIMKHHGLAASVSGKFYGPMKFTPDRDEREIVANRQRFLEQFGCLVSQLVMPAIEHGGHVARVHDTDAGKGAMTTADRIPSSDGLVTKSTSAILGVTVADCVPIFITDTSSGAFGVLHAGWRGLVAGILESAEGMMSKVWVANPLELVVSVGPCIRSCCFAVGEDVAQIFFAMDPASAVQRDGQWYVDLPGFIRRWCLSLGMLERHLEDSGICTVCSKDDWHSARGHVVDGRWDGAAGLAMIVRKEIRLLHDHDH
jgi:YfiH family protein